MKEIAIYVEGGGDKADQRSELRNGFDRLLDKQKQSARRKGIGWKLVPSGGRDQAYSAFIHRFEQADPDALVMLLVDSEGSLPPEKSKPATETTTAKKRRKLVDAQSRVKHLMNRDKHWTKLSDVPPLVVHLMVQCGEAWIAADTEEVEGLYGKGFLANRMPKTVNLESQTPHDLYDKLKKSSEKTKKGPYEKIEHASKLLAAIDASKVFMLCPRFATFTEWLDDQIASA